MHLYTLRILVPLLLMLGPNVAMSQGGRSPDRFEHRVAPQLKLWFASARFRRARLGSQPQRDRSHRVPVTIRLVDGASVDILSGLPRRHVSLGRCRTGVCALGPIVTARVDAVGVQLLEALPQVARVELELPDDSPPPLFLTTSEVHASQVWGVFDAAQIPVTGRGMVIADLDTGVDVLHPAFFRADGGYFDWIDVDDNGRFDPGTDAVDLNGNGVADVDETVRFYDARAYNYWVSPNPVLDSADGEYDLGWDYLYADLDGSGARECGADAGFSESDPSYGEPLLLADDVNGNGRLDPGEKLVALGSSKIRAVLVGSTEYVRGTNLIETPYDEVGHGTGVVGVLAAGSPGLTIHAGVAPEADILVVSMHQQDTTHTEALTWAVDNGADVVLHEYARFADTHLDGSTNAEAAIDAAAALGVVQVTATGNLGHAMKHCRLSLAPGELVTLPMTLSTNYSGYTKFIASFHWRQPTQDLSFTLRSSSTEEIPLGIAGTGDTWESAIIFDNGTSAVWATRDDSPRGTAYYNITVWGGGGTQLVPLQGGTWQIDIEHTGVAGQAQVELSGYVRDGLSGWNVGAHFPQHASQEHLVCYPSTADTTLSVGAYAGHDEFPFNPLDEASGELRGYSGRGKRIDGVAVLDLAAPDNPLVPLGRSYLGLAMPDGAHVVFGGTSGAAPHVAGAAALLLQLDPTLSSDQVRTRLRDSALVDADVTGDAVHEVEDRWGAGKLRVFEALIGQTPVPNTPPTLSTTTMDATVGQAIDLTLAIADDQDDASNLQVLWDDNYDGVWDAGPETANLPRRMTFDATGLYLFKVRVLDSGGLADQALVTVNVREPVTDPEPHPEPSESTGCGCRASHAPAGLLWALVLFGFAWIRRSAR